MKRFLFCLASLALVAPLSAQTPAEHGPIAKTGILPVSHLFGGVCAANCCPEKVCVSEPTTKKTSTTVFGTKCIEYCLPKCSFGGGCDSCASNCGPVRVKHVLMKKVVTTECPSTHCVVQLAPGCAATIVTPTMPPAEKVPAPLPKSVDKK